MKKYFLLIILLLTANFRCFSQMLQIGEEIVYDVSFLAIELGTIKIITLPDTNFQGEKVVRSKVLIQSNSNIPFYSLKAVFSSFMDTSFAEGRYFEANTKENNEEWGFQKITFRDKNAKNENLRVEKWYSKEKINDTTFENIGKVIDGSTLFFYARKNSDKKINVKLPTIMDLTVGNTKVNFTGKIEKIKINSINYPVKAYYLTGKAEWIGVYGLGDKFEGWFSADEAKIPLKAKMNVYLGSIDIELKSWKRNGWIPPKFVPN